MGIPNDDAYVFAILPLIFSNVFLGYRPEKIAKMLSGGDRVRAKARNVI